jgi:hypothetical protein
VEDERDWRETHVVTYLIFVGEGQTEESFARDVLAPELLDRQLYLNPRLIRTSTQGKGGALSWDRVRRFLRNTLRERRDTYVTTFFDLYQLDSAFPGWIDAQGLPDPRDRATEIERQVHIAMVEEAGCRESRFIPHIQPYEFEALIFANVDALGAADTRWIPQVQELRQVRNGVPSPEHINDGQTTHPSARLTTSLSPSYRKVLHGVTLTRSIGITRIRAECSHFNNWLTTLERLEPL